MGILEVYSTRHRHLLEKINAAGRQVHGMLGNFAHSKSNMRKVLIKLEGESRFEVYARDCCQSEEVNWKMVYNETVMK